MARLNTAERRSPETRVDPLAHVFEMPSEPRRVIRHPNARVMPAAPVYPPVVRPVPAPQPESFISRNLNFLLPSLVAVGMILMLIFGLILGGIGVYAYFNSSKMFETGSKPVRTPVTSPSKPIRLSSEPNAKWYLERGNDFLKYGRFQDAEEKFREAVHLSPNDAVCLVHLAVSLFHQREFGESQEIFQRATQVTSEKYYLNYAYSYLGRIEWERKNYSHAGFYFGAAVEIEPNDFGSMACWGFTLKLDGQDGAAKAILQRVLDESRDENLKYIVQQVLEGANPPTTATNAGIGPTQ